MEAALTPSGVSDPLPLGQFLLDLFSGLWNINNTECKHLKAPAITLYTVICLKKIMFNVNLLACHVSSASALAKSLGGKRKMHCCLGYRLQSYCIHLFLQHGGKPMGETSAH